MPSFYFGSGMRVVDVLFGFGLAALVALVLSRLDLIGPLYDLICRDGSTIYGSLVATLASLLGFAIAAISIVVGLISTQKFSDLRGSIKYSDFWMAFTWAIQSLGFATVVCLVAIFLNVLPNLRMWVLLAAGIAVIIAVSSLARSGITLMAVLDVARTKADEPPSKQVSTYRPVVP